jgi:hypothetical protein
MSRQSTRTPRSATYEERTNALTKRLGLNVPSQPLTATQWIRLWAEIGMELAEQQSEFRFKGRRKGFKPRPRLKDLEALHVVRIKAMESRLSFKAALREMLPVLKDRGLLEKSGDRTKDPKRLRRLHKEHGGQIFDLVNWDM